MSRSAPKVFRDEGFHLSAVETGGAFFAAQGSGKAGEPTPLHVHHGSDEFVFVTSGVLAITVSDARELIGTGEAVWLPRGYAHRFEIVEDASWLVVGSASYEGERAALGAAEGVGEAMYAGIDGVDFIAN